MVACRWCSEDINRIISWSSFCVWFTGFSVTQIIWVEVVGWSGKAEWERTWKKAVKNFTTFTYREIGKPLLSINHKILSPNLSMNRVTPVHEAGVAATRPQLSGRRWKRVLKVLLRPSLAWRERGCCVESICLENFSFQLAAKRKSVYIPAEETKYQVHSAADLFIDWIVLRISTYYTGTHMSIILGEYLAPYFDLDFLWRTPNICCRPLHVHEPRHEIS